MLLKDFYKLQSLDKTGDQKYTAGIVINAAHDVFKGHFPDNPVTPGVCMMQIIKEITEQVVNAPLTMKSASNVKFMALINPEVTPELKLELEIIETEDALIKVKNTTCFNDTTALKLSCIYTKN